MAKLAQKLGILPVLRKPLARQVVWPVLQGFCLLSVIRMGAQTTPSSAVGTSGSDLTAVHALQILPSAQLGADDLLEIYVADCPQLSRSFRIGADGQLTLPLLPHPLAVAGLTPVQVSEQLRKALVHDEILVEPVVNVAVLEFRSRPVSVIGAVMHPVTFQAAGRSTLMDAVAAAGGLSSTAGGSILLTVPEASGTATARVIAVKDLMGGVAGANPQLRGGEEIRIPEAQKFFVAGNVVHPGMFVMQSDTDTTVVKAVTLSAGLAPYSANYALIYRRRPTGLEREELKIPLTDIMKHREPDIALRADDILYIPSSNGKRITTRVIENLAGFGQAAGGYAVIH